MNDRIRRYWAIWAKSLGSKANEKIIGTVIKWRLSEL